MLRRMGRVAVAHKSDLDLLAKVAIKLASGVSLNEEEKNSISETELKVAVKVAKKIRAEKKGLLYCGICGMGSFTRRGLFLHLVRVHFDEVRDTVLKEMKGGDVNVN